MAVEALEVVEVVGGGKNYYSPLKKIRAEKKKLVSLILALLGDSNQTIFQNEKTILPSIDSCSNKMFGQETNI